MGLKAYNMGDEAKAFEKLTEYLNKRENFGDHYLLNKIYGTLLYNKNHFSESEKYLYKVTQICPEDIQVHNMMKVIYHNLNNSNGEKVEESILKLLGVN